MSDIPFDHVAAHILRRLDDADDTNAVRQALDTGLAVYLQAGMGSGPAGEWLLAQDSPAGDDSLLRDGAVLFGDGVGRTIVRPADEDGIYALHGVSASADTDDNLRGIVLRDMTFLGWIEDAGFSEHLHLVSMSGVTEALIERVEFKGMRGDGLFLGSGNIAEMERHNLDVTVRDCVFDGINNNNRQGISVIDGDGVLIENCTFRNCSRNGDYGYTAPAAYDAMDSAEGPGMPGPIDFEPNADAFAIIRNITVSGCAFEDNSGRVGQIAFPIPGAVTAVPQGIRIVANRFKDYIGGGSDIFLDTYRVPTATSTDSAVVIEGNRGSNGCRPFAVFGIKGVLITESNLWENYDVYAALGFDGSVDNVRDIECRARLTLVGTDADLPGLLVSKAVGVTLRDMVLDRCGAASASGSAIMFHSGVTSDRVIIEGIRVVGASGQTAAIAASGHSFTSANNFARNNDLGGLTSAFVATGPGQILPAASLTWDPGNLVDGAGETSSAITVTGAAFGDRVDFAVPYDLQGMTCSAYVSAANTVRIRLQNETGGAINLASGSWKATVTKAA